MRNSPAMDESELILVKGVANDELDLRLCDPLDENFVSDLLVALGEPRPTPAESAGFVSDDYETMLASGSLLGLVSADGAVRSVFLERGEATDAEWIRVYDIVAARARSIGAYFGSEDGWTGRVSTDGIAGLFLVPRVTISKYLLNGLVRGLLIGGGLGGLIRPIGWVPGAIAGVIVGVAAALVLWRLRVARARR